MRALYPVVLADVSLIIAAHFIGNVRDGGDRPGPIDQESSAARSHGSTCHRNIRRETPSHRSTSMT